MLEEKILEGAKNPGEKNFLVGVSSVLHYRLNKPTLRRMTTQASILVH